VASRSVLAASFGWLVVLAAVYAADAGPPLSALAFTAATLLPLAAWATGGHLAATSADLRQVLTAADGRARVLVADALPPLAWVLAATAAGVLANVVGDPRPAAVSARLLGALLHMVCGGVGLALGLVLHAGHVSRGVQALVVLAVTLASARLSWLPPPRRSGAQHLGRRGVAGCTDGMLGAGRPRRGDGRVAHVHPPAPAPGMSRPVPSTAAGGRPSSWAAH
jgi:hypothetical protein